MPPFAAIKTEHFRPAFDWALAEHRAEIDTIAQNRAEPSFENTIAALEKGGRELERVANVFFVLAGADTSDDIEAIERDVSPLLARHNNALYLNPALYARIASLYKRRDSLGLSPEQARVLERYHTRFVRAGAALEKPSQERLAAINERLASLGTQFAQNVTSPARQPVPPPRNAVSRTNMRSPWRARQSKASCSSHPGGICVKKRSRPGSGAARTVEQQTTGH
jgi:peptidyl-dipeptidase Dcp